VGEADLSSLVAHREVLAGARLVGRNAGEAQGLAASEWPDACS